MNTEQYGLITKSLSWDDVRASFKKIWGYDDFRAPQGEIVRCLLAKQDALIIMPTGAGKSICFQLPALLQDGLTLIISPLVALMENQVQELRDRHLLAALLHNEVPSYQKKQTLQALQQQKLRLLYLSPETLFSPKVWECLSQPHIKINALILDEAHCLVQWGETFRPAYRRLGAVRPELLKFKPPGTKIAIAAFTATADPVAQKTIQQVLKLSNPATFKINPYRHNLSLKVQAVWTPRGRRQHLLKFIKDRPKQSGLVYVRTRQDSEELAQLLSDRGYATAAYHAGLSPEDRRKIEANWLNGNLPFVICTCAFGMGINKSNVRWIVHFQPPFLLSEYVQEMGRAGRDGKLSEALILICEPTGWLYPEDKERQRFFAEKLQLQYQQAEKIAGQIPHRGEISTVAQDFRDGDFALSILHSAGKLEWLDPFHYQRRSFQKSDSFAEMQVKQTQIQSQITEYFNTKKCRWQFLLHAFGFNKEAVGFRCDRCDNCLRGNGE